jgi:tRNA (mo5U34)-methyltransferase
MSTREASPLVARTFERFDVTDQVTTALSSPSLEQGTSLDRIRDWQRKRRVTLRQRQPTIERLVPVIRRQIVRDRPRFMGRGMDGLSESALRAEIDRLEPWRVSFALGHGLQTMDGVKGQVAEERILFRRDLINGVVADLLGAELSNSDVLDIGCQAGFFSLDMADRGAASVTGVDLREGNLAQARFLAEHYGVDGVSFEQVDAEDYVAERQWDVVLNLGLLYHVTRPLDLLRTTYQLTRKVAVIDTVCNNEPVSAYLVVAERDTDKWDEGRDVVELHPTYRALLDGLRWAGFRHLVEVEGIADPPHATYASGNRRCILAFP